RTVAAGGPAAYQRLGEARIVLPAGLGELRHRRPRLLGIDAPGAEFAGQLPAGVLAPGQQAERPLQRGLRLAGPPPRRRVVAHAAGANPCPPTGRVSTYWPNAAISGLPRASASRTAGSASEARWRSALSETSVIQPTSELAGSSPPT